MNRTDDTSAVTVPSSDVEVFLQTLKDYSDSCQAAVAEVKSVRLETKKMASESEATCKENVRKSRGLLSDMTKKHEKQQKEMETVLEEVNNIDSLADGAAKNCREVRRALTAIESKEGFICSFVDIVKRAERLTRDHYTRTLYAATMCKEVCMVALTTLEATVRMLQSVGSKSEDEQSKLRELISKAEILRADVSNMERSANILQQVRYLDESMRVGNGEVNGICLNCEDATEGKKCVESMVRTSMPFQVAVHGTVSNYETIVERETERRVKVTEPEGSVLLAATASLLRRNGVENPGDRPTGYDNADMTNTGNTMDDE